MGDNIKVAIRVRPRIPREIKKNEPERWCVESQNTIYQTDEQGQKTSEFYHFDHIFDSQVGNEKIYQIIGKPLIESALQGFNSTIFAYGQTSSGKTYTMMGNSQEKGFVPLAVTDMFHMLQQINNRKFLIRSSYIEIYNEKINDLLNKDAKDIKLRENINGVVTVNVTEHISTSIKDILDLMAKGEKNRQIGETNMNDRSSRSHTIFRIIIESSDLESDLEGTDVPVQVSQLNFVDLAGSERISQTKATGARLKEGSHINKSLTSLGLVIHQLSEGSEFVNFRDSKLTRLLQHSLGGNAKTLMIGAITPVSVENGQTTLAFAQRAKSIKNKPEINETLSGTAVMRKYEKQICKLKIQLTEQYSLNKNLETDQAKKDKVITELQKHINLLEKNFVQTQKQPIKRRHTICAVKPLVHMDAALCTFDKIKGKSVTGIDPFDDQVSLDLITPEKYEVFKSPRRRSVKNKMKVADKRSLFSIPEETTDMKKQMEEIFSTPPGILRQRLALLEEENRELSEFLKFEQICEGEAEQSKETYVSIRLLDEILKSQKLARECNKWKEKYESLKNGNPVSLIENSINFEDVGSNKGNYQSSIDNQNYKIIRETSSFEESNVNIEKEEFIEYLRQKLTLLHSLLLENDDFSFLTKNTDMVEAFNTEVSPTNPTMYSSINRCIFASKRLSEQLNENAFTQKTDKDFSLLGEIKFKKLEEDVRSYESLFNRFLKEVSDQVSAVHKFDGFIQDPEQSNLKNLESNCNNFSTCLKLILSEYSQSSSVISEIKSLLEVSLNKINSMTKLDENKLKMNKNDDDSTRIKKKLNFLNSSLEIIETQINTGHKEATDCTKYLENIIQNLEVKLSQKTKIIETMVSEHENEKKALNDNILKYEQLTNNFTNDFYKEIGDRDGVFLNDSSEYISLNIEKKFDHLSNTIKKLIQSYSNQNQKLCENSSFLDKEGIDDENSVKELKINLNKRNEDIEVYKCKIEDLNKQINDHTVNIKNLEKILGEDKLVLQETTKKYKNYIEKFMDDFLNQLNEIKPVQFKEDPTDTLFVKFEKKYDVLYQTLQNILNDCTKPLRLKDEEIAKINNAFILLQKNYDDIKIERESIEVALKEARNQIIELTKIKTENTEKIKELKNNESEEKLKVLADNHKKTEEKKLLKLSIGELETQLCNQNKEIEETGASKDKNIETLNETLNKYKTLITTFMTDFLKQLNQFKSMSFSDDYSVSDFDSLERNYQILYSGIQMISSDWIKQVELKNAEIEKLNKNCVHLKGNYEDILAEKKSLKVALVDAQEQISFKSSQIDLLEKNQFTLENTIKEMNELENIFKNEKQEFLNKITKKSSEIEALKCTVADLNYQINEKIKQHQSTASTQDNANELLQIELEKYKKYLNNFMEDLSEQLISDFKTIDLMTDLSHNDLENYEKKYKNLIANLQGVLSDYCCQVKLKSDEIYKLTENLTALKNNYSHLEKEKESLDNARKKITSDLINSNRNIEILREQSKIFQSKNESLEKQLETTKDQLKNEITSLNTLIKVKETEIASIKQKLSQTKNECSSCSTAAEEKKELQLKIFQKAQKMVDIQAELMKTKELLQKSNSKVSQDEVEYYKSLAESLQKQLEKPSKSFNDVGIQVQELQLASHVMSMELSYKREVDDLKKKNEIYKSIARSRLQEIEKLKKAVMVDQENIPNNSNANGRN